MQSERRFTNDRKNHNAERKRAAEQEFARKNGIDLKQQRRENRPFLKRQPKEGNDPQPKPARKPARNTQEGGVAGGVAAVRRRVFRDRS